MRSELRGIVAGARRPKVTRDYLNFLVDPAVRRFCGPLFFTKSLQTPVGNVPSSGTFGLVDTGKRKLLVTCWHVWEDLKQQRRVEPQLRLSVCLDMGSPVVIDADDLLIDSCRRCDLATFDAEPLLPAIHGLRDFFNIHASPPAKPSEGDIIYLIGFTGKGREEKSDGIGFPRQAFGTQASQVGHSSFFADCSRLKLSADDVGGISGAPCFKVPEDGRPIRLVGFATGFSGTVLNALQFTYARYIKEDGMLDYMS